MSKKYDVYAMGNALVDMEFEVSAEFLQKSKIEKGLMTLVDEARQNELIESIHGIHHRRSCGGSAANSAIAIAQLGGKSFYSCRIANDEVGRFYVSELQKCGVALHAKNICQKGISGRCMVFVTPDADRTMNTFLGVSAGFSDMDLSPEELRESEYLYIEGYFIATEPGFSAVQAALHLAKEAGIKTSLTFSDPGIVSFFKQRFQTVLATKIDFIFCNEKEAFAYVGSEDMTKVVSELKKCAHAFAITRGPLGAMIWDGQKEIYVVAPKVEAVDTVGAGDAFAGCFLYGLTHGLTYELSGQLACTAASKVVTQFGARLTNEQMLEIRKDIISK